jgi:NAD(P)-dependent dehydrogenase (short-subunit alcohol dehydrogenase family)
VIVADVNEDGGKETVDMIARNGVDATFMPVDVSDSDSVMAVVLRTVETYGRMDCAINNAGISQRD